MWAKIIGLVLIFVLFPMVATPLVLVPLYFLPFFTEAILYIGSGIFLILPSYYLWSVFQLCITAILLYSSKKIKLNKLTWGLIFGTATLLSAYLYSWVVLLYLAIGNMKYVNTHNEIYALIVYYCSLFCFSLAGSYIFLVWLPNTIKKAKQSEEVKFQVK